MTFTLKERSPAAKAAYFQGCNFGIESCAQILDEQALEYNKLRDPGMANHCRALARRLRNLKTDN